jgi:hypothetical protein
MFVPKCIPSPPVPFLVLQLPELGKKAPLVCIPTTSGTGSEVTPFAVVTDDTVEPHQKYPLADYALTPTMAIVDTHLVRIAFLRLQNLERRRWGNVLCPRPRHGLVDTHW